MISSFFFYIVYLFFLSHRKHGGLLETRERAPSLMEKTKDIEKTSREERIFFSVTSTTDRPQTIDCGN